MADWIATNSELPSDEALIWSGGRFAVAVVVARPDGTKFFMEKHSDCVLEWPSHWLALPDLPPKDR